MNTTTLILIWLFILAVIMLSTPTQCHSLDKSKEGFYTNYGYYKKYCPSCGWRSRYSCSKCTNCGYCITASGYGECVPGDSSGPYFREDCQYWEYGDPYYYYPYSNIFPIVKTKSIYPYYRYRLRQPWRWQNRNNDRFKKNTSMPKSKKN